MSASRDMSCCVSLKTKNPNCTFFHTLKKSKSLNAILRRRRLKPIKLEYARIREPRAEYKPWRPLNAAPPAGYAGRNMTRGQIIADGDFEAQNARPQTHTLKHEICNANEVIKTTCLKGRDKEQKKNEQVFWRCKKKEFKYWSQVTEWKRASERRAWSEQKWKQNK